MATSQDDQDPVSPEEQRVPPYWQQAANARWSYMSVDANKPPPIRLEDHTEDGSDSSKALWARHVSVDDYVIISGNLPGVGAYVVWNCTVETLNVRLRCIPLLRYCKHLPCRCVPDCALITDANREVI